MTQSLSALVCMTEEFNQNNTPPRCIGLHRGGDCYMEGNYIVWLGKEAVGQAIVERQGLYYSFNCQCQLHSEVMCRVTVSCGGSHVSLGILVPMGKDYGLTKKLPIKNFPPGTPEFWITPKQIRSQGIYVDVYPEEPFRYIAKLEKAYLDKHKGRPGIRIDEWAEVCNITHSPQQRNSGSAPLGNDRCP